MQNNTTYIQKQCSGFWEIRVGICFLFYCPLFNIKVLKVLKSAYHDCFQVDGIAYINTSFWEIKEFQ